MITKIYRTRRLTLLYIPVILSDGTTEKVIFRGGTNMDLGAVYGTSNKEIQAALDAICAKSGASFYLERTIGEEDKPVTVEKPAEEAKAEEPAADVLDAREFNNLVELRNALVANGVDIKGLNTVQNAEAAAKKAGYLYTVKSKKN